jgi:hypothetical protein
MHFRSSFGLPIGFLDAAASRLPLGSLADEPFVVNRLSVCPACLPIGSPAGKPLVATGCPSSQLAICCHSSLAIAIPFQ